MAKSRPQVMNELKKWEEWLVNHVPGPARWEVCEEFETFHSKVISLYTIRPPPLRSMHTSPGINLIENETLSIMMYPTISSAQSTLLSRFIEMHFLHSQLFFLHL